jgi:hypothetical protein
MARTLELSGRFSVIVRAQYAQRGGVHFATSHRLQYFDLTSTLRLNDVPVPSIYGPSADEGRLGGQRLDNLRGLTLAPIRRQIHSAQKLFPTRIGVQAVEGRI